MASALPKHDVSLSWPWCRRPGCSARHDPAYDCPPRGVWLVRHFCPACKGDYCARHCGECRGRDFKCPRHARSGLRVVR